MFRKDLMALVRTIALVALAAAAGPALAQTAPSAKAPAQPSAEAWPRGAPHQDYEFTAWCYGVLRQHMELYNQVKPELQAISKRWQTEEEDAKSYADQLAAGRMYLTQFSRALEAAEKASPRPINAQGAAAIEQGRKMWAQFNTVDKTMQAYSWMNWELPDKCIKVAGALENKSLLMAPALKANLPANAAGAKKADSAAVAPAPAGDAVGALIEDAGGRSSQN
jgi:hypothetical protein